MLTLFPENGFAVSQRRHKGDALVALAVSVSTNADGGIEWRNGRDTDWCALIDFEPVAKQKWSFAAGLVCVVHHVGANNRHLAVARELLRCGAGPVFVCRAGEQAFRCRVDVDGQLRVVLSDGVAIGQVLSLARARGARRAAA